MIIRMGLAVLRRIPGGGSLALLASTLVCPAVAGGQAAPVLSRPADQARFTVTTFATGLAFPTSMASLSDGSLLVATTANSPNSALFDGIGQLVRLTDTNNDGIADGPPQILATGLPGIVTSVRRVGNTVIALSAEDGKQAMTFWQTGATAGDPLVATGQLNFNFPGPFWLHTTYALAVRPNPAGSGLEVYFNVGSKYNEISTPVGNPVGLTGSPGTSFVAASVEGDGIYRVIVDNSGATASVSSPLRIASGLRNAAGLAFDADGNLYFSENGIDTPSNDAVAFSADELNRIDAADLGVTVPHFGFSETYVRYPDGVTINPDPNVTGPRVSFLPVGSERSEGPVEIAFAPLSFGVDFLGGVFTTFYGNGQRGGMDNEENPVVFANPITGDYYHFFENQQMGHPQGLLSTPDALFLSDLSYTGLLYGSSSGGVRSDEAGVIYRITANADETVLPEPSTWALVLGGLVGMGLVTRRRARR